METHLLGPGFPIISLHIAMIHTFVTAVSGVCAYQKQENQIFELPGRLRSQIKPPSTFLHTKEHLCGTFKEEEAREESQHELPKPKRFVSV